MNVLLIVFILLMVFLAARGRRKGMALLIFEILACAFIVYAARYGKIYVKDFLRNYTNVSEKIEVNIQEKIEDKIGQKEESGLADIDVYKKLPSLAQESVKLKTEEINEHIAIAISKSLTEYTLDGLAAVASMIVACFLVAIIKRMLRWINRIPIIGDVNRMLGIICGAAEGLLLCFIILYIAACFPTTVFGSMIIDQALSSPITNYIYENNPLLIFVV